MSTTVRREKAQAERVAAELIQSRKAALNRYDELHLLATHAYLRGVDDTLDWAKENLTISALATRSESP